MNKPWEDMNLDERNRQLNRLLTNGEAHHSEEIKLSDDEKAEIVTEGRIFVSKRVNFHDD